MRMLQSLAAVCLLASSSAAVAELEPFTDYDISDAVWSVTTVKVHPNMMDTYLEGIRETWVASNEIAKELGHIESYSIFTSELEASGHFNLMLVIKFPDTAALAPSKEKYDAFMAKWTEEQEERSDALVQDYPSMRKITGEYHVRQLSMK